MFLSYFVASYITLQIEKKNEPQPRAARQVGTCHTTEALRRPCLSLRPPLKTCSGGDH